MKSIGFEISDTIRGEMRKLGVNFFSFEEASGKCKTQQFFLGGVPNFGSITTGKATNKSSGMAKIFLRLFKVF